jgi:DNA polymerase-1
MKKLVVVDVSNMFFRAFYGVPALSNKKGMHTNAIFGFLKMALNLTKMSPDYFAFCMEGGSSFRKDIFSEYKGNRSELPEELKQQFPYIPKVIESLGFKQIQQKTFEADDIIGTLSKKASESGIKTIIISGDKDFSQLINENVELVDTMRNITYASKDVFLKYGVEPKNFIDYLAIVGDSSDNIPGVSGIGAKGASNLLNLYDSLEGIYENIEKVKGKNKEKLIASKDNAFLSKRLATIVTDIPIEINWEDFKRNPINKELIKELIEELEFTQLDYLYKTQSESLSELEYM